MHLFRQALPASHPLGANQLLAWVEPPWLPLQNWANQPHAQSCSVFLPFSDLNESQDLGFHIPAAAEV